MGLIFGLGTALMAIFFLARLLPRLIGLSFWLGSAGITAGTALAVLYLATKP